MNGLFSHCKKSPALISAAIYLEICHCLKYSEFIHIYAGIGRIRHLDDMYLRFCCTHYKTRSNFLLPALTIREHCLH